MGVSGWSEWQVCQKNGKLRMEAPKGQEPPKKRRKIPEADLNETEVIIITNLTR